MLQLHIKIRFLKKLIGPILVGLPWLKLKRTFLMTHSLGRFNMRDWQPALFKTIQKQIPCWTCWTQVGWFQPLSIWSVSSLSSSPSPTPKLFTVQRKTSGEPFPRGNNRISERSLGVFVRNGCCSVCWTPAKLSRPRWSWSSEDAPEDRGEEMNWRWVGRRPEGPTWKRLRVHRWVTGCGQCCEDTEWRDSGATSDTQQWMTFICIQPNLEVQTSWNYSMSAWPTFPVRF